MAGFHVCRRFRWRILDFADKKLAAMSLPSIYISVNLERSVMLTSSDLFKSKKIIGCLKETFSMRAPL